MQPDPARLIALESNPLHDQAALEASLAELPAPRGEGVLLEKFAALGVQPQHTVLDLGCGHGQYARQVASTLGCTVIAIDFSSARARETRTACAALSRVHAGCAMAEALPLRDGSVDFIWCRDMLYGTDLPRTLADCARVLRPGGHMLVYLSFATDLLEPGEARRLLALGTAMQNMDPAYFEACAETAGFGIVERDVIGTEWRETWEADGGSRRTSIALLRAAQLVRGGDALRERVGDEAYEFAMNDQLWGIYQMIGKLRPTAYVLRRR